MSSSNMNSNLNFHGRVAIVTGAGSGIGREIALLLGARGASVLVNALEPAEEVAQAIRAAGGLAVCDVTPVSDFAAGRAIVQHAVDAFGRLDILVNNAGISAPGSFTEVPEQDYLNVLQVNLIGPLALSRAAWPVMAAQAYGRILNMASNAALGMGRSAAYAASKGGLLSLTKDNAREGQPLGIKVNAMLPVAHTRLTEKIPPGMFRDWLEGGFAAERVAPPAVFLCSEALPVSGEIFSCGGGRMARTAYLNTHGYFDPAATPESIAANFAQVMDTQAAVVVDNHSQELNRYTEWLPWPEPGGMPGMSRREP